MNDYITGIMVAARGIGTTLQITCVAVIIGVLVGLIIALCKISKFKTLRAISSVYIDVLRGTPLMVQVLLVYIGLPYFMQQTVGIEGFKWSSALVVSMVVCGINSSAYVAEIIRAGLQAIDKGQTEAARSLGMSYWQTMRFVIVPQAFRVIIPALGNEFITLIKETAILSVITITDITRSSMLWASSTFIYFPAYIGTAIVYMILTIPLSKVMNLLERKLANDVKS